MNFEKNINKTKQNFKNLDSQEEYQKNSPEFKKFLHTQILLPKEQWSNTFKTYIQYITNEQKNTTEKYTKQMTFDRYLKGLDLKIEGLKDKKIIDIGCGENGEFVKQCINNNITNSIYGFDKDIKWEKLEDYSKHFQQGLMQNNIPIDNVDYAVSVGALSLFSDKSENKANLEQAINTLNKTGELRIWPISLVSEESDLKGIKEKRDNWLSVLKELSTQLNIKYKFLPTDISVSGHNQDVWLDEVLIIKKSS